MVRIRPALVAALTVGVLLVSTLATVAWAQSGERAAPRVVAVNRYDTWATIAQAALAKFEAVDHTAVGGTGSTQPCGTVTAAPQRASTYSWAAEASGRLRGWDDPRTTAYLNKVRSMKNPDGGWGLPCPYDQLADGTTNPATTTYSVTLAGHVGATFLEGYKHGVVTFAELRAIVVMLKNFPQINTAQGTCVAYSNAPGDRAAGTCVHNSNAGVAAFLLDANAAGVGTAGIAQLAEDVTRREVYAYRSATRDWTYSELTTMSTDPDHTSYEVWGMYQLAPSLASNAAYVMMHTAAFSPPRATDALVYPRLAWLPSAIAGVPAGAPDRWCAMADPYVGQVSAYLASNTNLLQLAQLAQITSKTADVCGAFDTVPPSSEPPSSEPSTVEPSSPEPSSSGE